MKYTVAIVGRPNVGKSTFFNKLSGKRLSIVMDTPGVTRDRIIAQSEWCGYQFNCIDTGGIEIESEDVILKGIKRQATVAMETADVIIFVVDSRQGIMPDDYEIAGILRTTGKPIVLVVNKMDNYRPEDLYEFYRLGLGEPMGISAEQSTGIGDVLDEVVKNFEKVPLEEEETGAAIKVAFVGRPNVGKSSIINKILGQERLLVSDIAGTTRDTIDTPFHYEGTDFVIVDTAGMRRKRSVDDRSVEAISAIKAIRAIERADVVVIMADSSEGSLSEQDVRIAGYVHEAGKPSIIALNKWDAVEKDTYTIEEYIADLDEKLKFMAYHVPVFVSAKTGKRVDKLLQEIIRVHSNATKRLTTGMLNEVISDAVSTTEPPAFSGRRLKIYYATQAATAPPTFVFFVNEPKLMHFSYMRYLENALRRAMDFSGTPIVLQVKSKTRD